MFKEDGFYLIDSTDTPMKGLSASKKEKQIKSALPSLLEKIRTLISADTKIILISATVYKTCADILKSEGFNVINEVMIDFPGSGGQVKYRTKMNRLLIKHGLELRTVI